MHHCINTKNRELEQRVSHRTYERQRDHQAETFR